MTMFIKNEPEMIKLGTLIGQKLPEHCIVALFGDLGAGKTTLVKGIGKGLGEKREITSPTYTIVKNYDKFNHFDVYRVSPEEMLEVGFLEMLETKINIIEWAERILEILPESRIDINIKSVENGRELTITPQNSEFFL